MEVAPPQSHSLVRVQNGHWSTTGAPSWTRTCPAPPFPGLATARLRLHLRERSEWEHSPVEGASGGGRASTIPLAGPSPERTLVHDWCAQLDSNVPGSAVPRSCYGATEAPPPRAQRVGALSCGGCVRWRSRLHNPTRWSESRTDTGPRLVRPAGLEPATCSLEGCCSIHLSYGRAGDSLSPPGGRPFCLHCGQRTPISARPHPARIFLPCPPPPPTSSIRTTSVS